MILGIFIMLVFISIVFIIIGYTFEDAPEIFQFTGFLFLFLLSFIIIPNMPGELEYCTGSIITETATGFTTTDVYSIYEDATIGLYLFLASALGFAMVYITMGENSQYD